MSQFADNSADFANNALHITPVKEDMTGLDDTINCNLAENKNNPVCNAADTFFDAFLIIVVIVVILYAIIIFAAVKTKNSNLKIFLIVSIFIPFLAPIGLILALLILINAI